MTAVPDMEKQPLLDSQQTEPKQECTLSELQQDVFKAQRAYMRAWSRTTNGRWHRRLIFAVTGLLLLIMVSCGSMIVVDSLLEDDDDWSYATRVPLEAHIMSKCPDAKDCLHDMILPAMQNVSHKVDFRLSYIGTTSQHDDGVACKHGQEECLGNIVELCVARQYPSPQTYLGFTMCLSKDYQDIPRRELVEDCALEHGISMQKINECATLDNGGQGVEMLQQSFNRSAEAGVSKSCTVRLNGKVRCIRDGGEWVDCEGGSKASDLVRDVNDAYEALWNRY